MTKITKSKLTAINIQKHPAASKGQIERARELLIILNDSENESEVQGACATLEKISLDIIRAEYESKASKVR